MLRVLRDNSLSIVLIVLATSTIAGMFFTGFAVYNEELAEHGAATVSLAV